MEIIKPAPFYGEGHFHEMIVPQRIRLARIKRLQRIADRTTRKLSRRSTNVGKLYKRLIRLLNMQSSTNFLKRKKLLVKLSPGQRRFVRDFTREQKEGILKFHEKRYQKQKLLAAKRAVNIRKDAHNCIVDFDVNTSLFAVYDGHCGPEVAVYCSQKLPQYIKNTDAYKNRNFEKALVDAFLGFDATIVSPKVVAELKQIAAEHKKIATAIQRIFNRGCDEEDEIATERKQIVDAKPCKNESRSGGEEDVSNVYEVTKPESSATVSTTIKSVEKNGSLQKPEIHVELANSSGSYSKDNKTDTDEFNPEDNETDKKASSDQPNQNDEVQTPSKMKTSAEIPQEHFEISRKATVCRDVTTIKPDEKNGSLQKPEIHVELANSSGSDCKDNKTVTDESIPKNNETDIKAGGDETNQNGEVQTPSKVEMREVAETPQENVEISEIGKDKAIVKSEEVPKSPTMKTEPKRNEQLDDDDDEGNKQNKQPGFISGCTAILALLHENQLFVANAGDSRCILCRHGKAIEMSIDHHPRLEQEYKRVIKAGGYVSSDNRINDNLNLSRAIGDHKYKKNKELSDREQMITALPDVRSITIDPRNDEFMVLACDGIWNSMSSQEVVDFVRPRIQEFPFPKKLSQICEEMFERCLAGCDNMTCIIVQFKKNSCKKAALTDNEVESENLKRAKTEETILHSASTS